MCRFRTVGILRMLDGCHIADILCHLAAKRCSQRLDTTTDTQHRNLTVVGQTGNQQFGQVAFLIDTMQLGRRLLACPKGIDITSTTQDKGVDML